MINISVVIVTKDGEDRIGNTINSVLEFKEIIIVIDASTKNKELIKDIANTHENIQVYETEFIDFSQIKKLGIKKANSEYILILDDDETVSGGLISFLKNENLKGDGYNIFFQEYMWWQYNKYATWGSYHLRLVKSGMLYEGGVHEYFPIDKKI